MSDGTRLEDVKRFYEILGKLERRVGERRILAEYSRSSGWPTRGVYFFMENGEDRSESGDGLRIVRVGTHSVKTGGSKTSLWNRLSQHKGSTSGLGNHRGSIFRALVGRALINKDSIKCETWESKTTPSPRGVEQCVEIRVSETIGRMPFLWLEVDDKSKGANLRNYIESNAIALLSNFCTNKLKIDAPSSGWLGYHCTDTKGNLNQKVRESGLWNQKLVDSDRYYPGFLDKLEELVEQMEAVR
ncbi:MAG: hypothetical protein F4W91_13715 [Gemmatimonadetes bacterium]|nr:hypothetical protein [Gemmatimonadota bacterium]